MVDPLPIVEAATARLHHRQPPIPEIGVSPSRAGTGDSPGHDVTVRHGRTGPFSVDPALGSQIDVAHEGVRESPVVTSSVRRGTGSLDTSHNILDY